MDAMSEVFLQYTNYLEKEQEIKTNILSAIKSLETISYAITLQMERMHNSVDDKSIQRTCELINRELLKAKEAYKDLGAVVPINQFYRYNYLFRNHTQKMVQATALLVYFKEDRLVKMEEVAALLGLKSFETSLQISEDTSSLQKMSFGDARTSSPGTKAHSTEQNVADSKSVREELSRSEPPVFTGLEEPIKSCGQVMNLAVSCTGTKLILTPASPRPRNSRSSSTDSEDFLPSVPAADTSYSRTLAQDSADPAALEWGRATASKASDKPTQLDTVNPIAVENDAAGSKETETAVSEETDAAESKETDTAVSEERDAAESKETDTAVSEESDAVESKETNSAVSDETAAGSKETDAAGSKETDAAGSKETDAAGSKETDAAGSKETDAAVSEETDAVGSKETDTAVSEETDAAVSKENEAAVSEKTDAVVSKVAIAPVEGKSRGQTRNADETDTQGVDLTVTTTTAGARAPGDGSSSRVAPAVTHPEDEVAKVLHPRTRCESEDFGNGPLLSASVVLYLDIEDFLIGCLMIGSELARLAVNAVSTGNFGLPFCINQFLRELHAGYTQLHLKNSFLRKTYDELKYSLKKTEDVVYNLSLRGLKPADSGQGSAKERVAGEEM